MGSLIELDMDGMAHGGEAMGRYQGKAIFVPYAIPGERVRAEIVEEKERWARARLVEVLRPSPDRVDPPCIYFGPGKCSGCQWQHIRYERQAEMKGEILADQLRRLGRIAEPVVRDTIVAAGGGDGEQTRDTWTMPTATRLGLGLRQTGAPATGGREAATSSRSRSACCCPICSTKCTMRCK